MVEKVEKAVFGENLKSYPEFVVKYFVKYII